MFSGNQVIVSTSGKYMTQVTVTKPSTLTPSNIKKGVNIGRIIGTYDGDAVFIREVSTISATTDQGVITFRTRSLPRYLCVCTSNGNSYVASADIRSVNQNYSYSMGSRNSLDITYLSNIKAYDFVWRLFSSDDSNYDGAYMTVYIIDD